MSGLGVAIFGATGAVGRDLLEVLPDSGLPIREYRLISSRSNKESHAEVAGERIGIHAMPGALEESALLEGVDLAFFATPPDISRQHAPITADIGIATVEIGGALSGLAPLCVPAVSEQPFEDFLHTRMISSPSAPAVALACVLDPLVRVGATAARGTMMLSAGLAGRQGMEELGKQVIALYSSGEPPRVIFPSGLAFDLIGQAGEVRDGWSAVERRVALEAASLVSMAPQSVALTAVLVPLFAGIGMSLFVELDPLPPLDDVRHFLSQSTALQLGDPVPGPRRLVGRPKIHVGRIRPDPLGAGVHLWVTLDNLRAGASGNAVAIAKHLWDEGLI